MAPENTRERLLTAAMALFRRQGFHRTALADIAHEAGVPLGNVYYHFRTKDALALAVIDRHVQALQEKFQAWEQDPDPRCRLKALARLAWDEAPEFVQYGCPYGTLCFELERDPERGAPAEAAAALIQMSVDWAEAQFRPLVGEAAARDHAVALVAAQQGTYLLANTYRSPELLCQQLERLAAWIDSV